MVESRNASAAIRPIPPGDITSCFLSPGATSAARFKNREQYRHSRNPTSDVLRTPSGNGGALSGRNGSSTYARKAPPVHHVRLQPVVGGDQRRATPETSGRYAAGYNGARFSLKIEAILKDLTENSAPGKVVARMYVVEFQKRVLPRAHVLCILSNEHAPRATDDYDDIVRAAIPDPEKEPALWNTITTSMMHGACGSLKPNTSCMEGGSRAKGCAQRSIDSAIAAQGFPEYRTPEGGRTVLKRGLHMENQWVVPYNPRIASKYNAQINVDVCSAVSAVKYL